MYIALKFFLLLILTFSFIFFYSIIGVFALIPFWIICGLIDVSRHKTMELKLIKEYFIGKGILTFLISPLNLFADLISHRNLHSFKIENFPDEFQNEINTVKKLFDQNKKKIEERFSQSEDNRTMLFYKWYGKNLDESINFNKVKKNGSYIEADGTINIWKNDPLFIFDDTLIHQSFNQEDNLRYCAFIDIVRPSYSNLIIMTLLNSVGFLLKKSRGIFYKNWKMI